MGGRKEPPLVEVAIVQDLGAYRRRTFRVQAGLGVVKSQGVQGRRAVLAEGKKERPEGQVHKDIKTFR